MLSHVLRDTVHIFKEAHMAKLIHLIMTDRLNLQLLLNILQIVRGRCNRSQTGTREADLAGRAELVYHIRIARALALCQNLDQMILIHII